MHRLRWRLRTGRSALTAASAAAVMAAFLAVGMMFLAGCGAATSAATRQQDQQFVDSVQSQASDVSNYRTATQLIRLGRAACDGFAGGASFEQLADRLTLSEGSHALPSEDLGVVITAAVTTFCPKYEDKVN